MDKEGFLKYLEFLLVDAETNLEKEQRRNSYDSYYEGVEYGKTRILEELIKYVKEEV